MTVGNGSAYLQPTSTFDEALTLVRRGTPMGELLRRYWHPVGIASDASDVPRRIMALGEELILFRDAADRPGLLHPRCAHRGSSLYYGKVEEGGLRCCYHGWMFDVEGRCVDQPCEPMRGVAKANVRQPWYPLEERYGLIFAYMGPPDRRPALPRYACLEELDGGEWVEADDSSIGSGGPVIVPCNWLQHFENVVDPFHVPILHGSFSGQQFVEMMGRLPEVSFSVNERGVKSVQRRAGEQGKLFERVTEAVIPTLRVVASPRVGAFQSVESIGWVLPMDDATMRIYVAGRVREAGALARMKSSFNGKSWFELTEAEHQQFPGDYEAQVSQGPITLHSEEHLATTDRGVALLRRMLRKQVATVAEGGDPIGVSFDADAPPVRFEAGNFLRDADT